MKSLLNPKWILIINTLPIAILSFLRIAEYQLIQSLLEDETKSLWLTFGIGLSVLGLANLGYAIYAIIKKQNVPLLYGVLALSTFIPFTYWLGFNFVDFIPLNIPRWLRGGNLLIYSGTFLMPTLIYSLVVIVFHLTPKSRDHNPWKNFGFALLIPIVWYLFSQFIIPLWRPFGYRFEVHSTLIFSFACTLAFLFFLVRAVLISALKKTKKWQKYQLAWKIPITLLFPLLGLALNNGALLNQWVIERSGVFGDFKNHWFYILAFLNGFFLCLPNLDNRIYRLLLFVGRSTTFPFTLYFFLVLLPFLPFSIMAIVAFGLGFLMLTPLLLFPAHINELSNDFTYLSSIFSKKAIRLFFISSLFILPLIITMNYWSDKHTLHQTLEYIYQPDYSRSYNIDKASIEKTLKIVKANKSNKSAGIFGTKQPYLSAYYKWLVFDNMTLSNAKIAQIEKIFFGETAYSLSNENNPNSKVEITDVSVHTTFDPSQKAWKSWIDLELTNQSSSNRFAEYATSFELPEGAWISDYYLYVEDMKEMGILSEKKAAKWVYSNIRNENRDPGILYYLTGNKVAFRVFPFSQNQVRKTGIEILHRDPLEFEFDGHQIELGDVENATHHGFENDDVIYISKYEKSQLAKITRSPYFHFLIDATSENKMQDYRNRVDSLCKRYPQLAVNAKISYVNTYVTTSPYIEKSRNDLSELEYTGGFYLDRAIKKVLFEGHSKRDDSFPILVSVTDSFYNSILAKDYSDWKFTFPESDIFYNLNKNGNIQSHSLLSSPMKKIRDSVEIVSEHKVLAYQSKNGERYYVRDNDEASIVLKKDHYVLRDEEFQEKNWESALTLQAKWNALQLHPETSDKAWLDLVKRSFQTKIMTPSTAYMVVENEAQKAILKRKQEQVLSGKKSLDLGEEAQRMSEPKVVLLILFLAIFLWYKRRNFMARD